MHAAVLIAVIDQKEKKKRRKTRRLLSHQRVFCFRLERVTEINDWCITVGNRNLDHIIIFEVDAFDWYSVTLVLHMEINKVLWCHDLIY